jgi:hypothetical protein
VAARSQYRRGERVDAGHMVHMEAANDVVRVLRGHL